MQTGYITTNFYERLKNGDLYTIRCYSFILLHEEYGPMIFDTGSIYDQQTLIDKLYKNFNLTPDDIKWVFITHCHPDHFGANAYFKNARIIMSERDLRIMQNISSASYNTENFLKYLYDTCPGYKYSFTEYGASCLRNHVQKACSIKTLGLHHDVHFIEKYHNIPDFIQPIASFGHTHYHYSFLLTFDDIKFLVSGDSLSMKLVLKLDSIDDRFNEPHMNYDSYFESLKSIRSFDGLIIPGHDRPFFSNSFKSIRKNTFTIKNVIERRQKIKTEKKVVYNY